MSIRIAKILNHTAKTLLKDLYYLPFDVMDSISGKRDEFTPPRRLIFVGDGDFRKTGDEFFRYFTELGGLKPNHKVLDVGCGIGRMAVPLTNFLTTGSYEGFDIVRQGISWSNRVISKRYPNFHFALANVYNTMYNPAGKYNASDYKFPYPDESFDFIFATSVFTHMLPANVENYFVEITRVLRTNGKALITYFLINSESKGLIQHNFSKLSFARRANNDGFWTISQDKPEYAVGYDEAFVMDLYRTHNLSILDPVHYGSWCGRKDYLSFQDIVVSQKD